MKHEWIVVKTRSGHIGQVLIDPTRPIADQISDQAVWWGRNLPEELPATVNNTPVLVWLIIYALVVAIVWIGGL